VRLPFHLNHDHLEDHRVERDDRNENAGIRKKRLEISAHFAFAEGWRQMKSWKQAKTW